nr:hypothetical protein 1 [bacterium]
MAYNKTNWVDDQTAVSASNMNKIEQGIKDAHGIAESHASRHASGGADPITPEDIGAEPAHINTVWDAGNLPPLFLYLTGVNIRYLFQHRYNL